MFVVVFVLISLVQKYVFIKKRKFRINKNVNGIGIDSNVFIKKERRE